MSMQPTPTPFPICPSQQLGEGRHLKVGLIFEGRREECLVFRYQGRSYAYINRCVHMPRPLDCEKDLIFDTTGRYLRCSMHGIVYTPETGTSVSTMCEGERLQSVAIYEAAGEVGIADFRVSALHRLEG
jgi:nitrite reductase/ring-hydroxylating ferredoxin subunit